MIRTLTAALATTTCIVAMVTPAVAQTQEYNISAGSLKDALDTYVRQSGRQVVYRADEVRSIRSPGARGALSAEAALKALLTGTGFTTKVDGKLIAIVKAGNAASVSSASSSSRADAVRDDTLIIVTGTNIRGIAPESSPAMSFSRDDIQNTGAATAQDFIQTIPQNFGGGANSDLPGGLPSGEGGFNGSFGSSANLRGLGQGSTLVLLNGRRMAPSSGVGDFADISMIPATAIERVDVVLDGASSIYGADAVAGVINFVLRDDFEGVEISSRYGTVTDGDFDEYRVSALAGTQWGSGNALISYEFLQQDNLSAADRDFAHGASLPQDLLPRHERHSLFAALNQDLSSDLDLFGELLFSRREAEQNFFDGAGRSLFQSPVSEVWSATLGGNWDFASDWSASAYGAYSSVSETVRTSGDITGGSESDSNIWTANLNLSGPLFSLPGGEVRTALGGQYRSESFDNLVTSTGALDRTADRDVYEVFGELFVPIFGPENAVPGIYRFEVNASARFSDFSDFGSTTNPKIGVLWAPIPELRVRGSYGTSYKPPALGYVGALDKQILIYNTALLNDLLGLTPSDPSIADVTAISVNGTADNLIAEESETITLGFDFDKRWGPHRITYSLNYFDIEYRNRLGQTPSPNNSSSFDAPNIAFVSPELFPPGTVIFNPTADQISDAISNLVAPAGSLPTGLDPFDATIIRYNAVVRNLGLTFTEGLDFNIGYQYDTGRGLVDLGVDGVILTKYAKQASEVTPPVDLLDTQFNPLDFKFRGRVGFLGDHVTAIVFLNHADGYRTDRSLNGTSIDSWTTFDLSLAYKTDADDPGILGGTTFRVAVQNLFDHDPPSTPGAPALQIFGYDPTNATPLNRFISFEISKRF